jgi:hypothetical protein
MQLSYSWRASIRSALKEMCHAIGKPEGSFSCSVKPAIGPNPEPDWSTLHPHLVRFILTYPGFHIDHLNSNNICFCSILYAFLICSIHATCRAQFGPM